MSAGKNKKQKSNNTIVKIVVVISIIAVLAVLGIIIGIKASLKPQYEPGLPRGCSKHGLCVDKPILYLYPTEETNVTVSFGKPAQLTTTYPKYYGGWNITAQPDGTLSDVSGQEYYALYWEEESNFSPDLDYAFYVTKDNAIDFLESKLTYIGLNNKERNEFIMYWLPILENNGQNLVRFAFTDELQSDNELKISPAPDSLLRIRIFVEKVDSNPNLPEPTLQTFERKGFAAIEWGGTKQ